MDVGKAMKDIREERGLSQRTMAKEVGITQPSLCKIERGRYEPKQKVIVDFCRVLRIPLAYFYQRSFTLDDYGRF